MTTLSVHSSPIGRPSVSARLSWICSSVSSRAGKRTARLVRLSQVELSTYSDPGRDCYAPSNQLLQAIAQQLGFELPASAVKVVRKSFDARKDLKFVYTVDVDVSKLPSKLVSQIRVKAGKVEILEHEPSSSLRLRIENARKLSKRKEVVAVVGGGPAGLFASLVLAELGFRVNLIERGFPVESRGRDIGKFMVRRILDPDSNFCFGEGGAGTWSDGKLTTRIGKNSQSVRMVLATLVRFGATPSIMVEGKPHIGTDKLVLILRNLRAYLQSLGVSISFGTKMKDLIVQDGRALGLHLVDSKSSETSKLLCDAVVLAVGHSARDVHQTLMSRGVLLTPKDFAVGLRVEHPQELVNEIQYREWAAEVKRGSVPVADYKLATTVSSMDDHRSCYSFCMCPGGQIVPTSTDPLHLCINGMSFSKRASKWANAALVVNVTSQDIEPFKLEHGALAGVAFQQALEREAALRGGGDFKVPAQTVPDFLENRISDDPTLPTSSYRLGVRSAALHDLLPPRLTEALKQALQRFDQQLNGFIDHRALLHGVEVRVPFLCFSPVSSDILKQTRTSSPVRFVRDDKTFESVTMPGLYPVGEGAGYAGGIVSAAVDGMEAAFALAKQLSSNLCAEGLQM